MQVTKKEYIFSGFIEGFGKCLFTIVPLVLGFNNFVAGSGSPVSTRISFVISILSMLFFYITEFSKTISNFVRLEIFIAIVSLSTSFVLTLLAFQKPNYSFTDLVALIVFAIAVVPLAIETFLAFLYLDCKYIRKSGNNKQRHTLLSRSAGAVASAGSKN